MREARSGSSRITVSMEAAAASGEPTRTSTARARPRPTEAEPPQRLPGRACFTAQRAPASTERTGWRRTVSHCPFGSA